MTLLLHFLQAWSRGFHRDYHQELTDHLAAIYDAHYHDPAFTTAQLQADWLAWFNSQQSPMTILLRLKHAWSRGFPRSPRRYHQHLYAAFLHEDIISLQHPNP